ncbi:Host cell surface-exposed lipoprotein [compost metagenome]
MNYNDIALWLENNKVLGNKSEIYSDTVPKGDFLSQSVKSGDKVYEGSTININYSLGKEPSTEFKNALKKAESYSKTMNMSKQGIYDQLTSQYGEKFPSDAAQYAIDNINVDFKINALEKAKSYQKTMSMSKSAVYDQLISKHGEKFTAEEAQYAVDHLDD